MHPSTLISSRADAWPALPLNAWSDTCDTLHMWTQIVGKIRLESTPFENHWWHSTLYVTHRGLTTSAIPYGTGLFEVRFDFIDHRLVIETSGGESRAVRLAPRTVADFYREAMAALGSLGIDIKIYHLPVEVPNPIPFDQDTVHAAYDPEYATRFWRILMSVSTVLREFRGRFIGKASPVHFFWGSFDLAASRFSGRRAPERPGADAVTREAYSHEVISAGWWPGGGGVSGPAFYAYAAPEPPGLAKAPVSPAQAFYSTQLSEFLLMYDDIRSAESPAAELLSFLESTYEAAAGLAHWDRESLERSVTRDATMHAS
jgi:Family of unknown function (DUF5996)